MIDMQKRILARIEEIAKEQELEVVSKEAWANTGHVYFYVERSYEPLCNLSYGFQDNYVTFDWTIGKGYEVFHAYVEYAEQGRMREFLNRLYLFLQQAQLDAIPF